MTDDDLEERLDVMEKRLEKIEEKNRHQVRVVDTDHGKRIILENRLQTWFSPNYFEAILEDIGSG